MSEEDNCLTSEFAREAVLFCYTISRMSVNTLNLLLIISVAGLLVWRGFVVIRVGLDARRRGFKPIEIIRWMLIAVIADDRYWWGPRLDRLSTPEARELLVAMAQAHQLLSVVDVRCPLCDSEIKNALAVADDGDLYVRRKAACAHCDFRVDACRHCQHFQPDTGGFTMFDRHGDVSHGRCGFYRAVEPVRTAYPRHARRLEAMGYDMLPTPKAITDSYIPLTECTAFSLKPELLRDSHVPWIDRQRVALIRLHQKINRSR
jgi:hypothetical protein